jgi:FKBP-type peptidyl-prolyl cis-trans isomerase
MSKWTWGFGVWLTVAVVAGCEEPARLVPSAPPGVNLRSTLDTNKETDENAAQALGEAVAQAAATTKKDKVIDTPPALPTKPGEVKTTLSGVKYETLKEGHGVEAKAGQTVTMKYTGTLEDGRKFDSSDSFTRVIGVRQLITGWDEAVPGMKIGERRKLTVPPSAGYGAQGVPGTIPPNAVLIFDVELLRTK